ncbi:MAG TPA: aminotransferase class V-fold PLP-dependent enzyme [Gemmatimonadales bacterium]|jgi:selenocysteine lyase/cysteine desulfurase|nr:aminotransferase class V-fold PLP-dependent enzyme [Gemmatimonadales bacterium]
MTLPRRQLLKTLAAAALFPAMPRVAPRRPWERPLRAPTGQPDWLAVRDLFPLAPDWTHLSSFLFVSHPKPVAAAIDHFRNKLDSDALWIERAAFSDAEGRPFTAVKRALAEYTGGSPTEIAFMSNTTTALAMAYHGLRIRRDQEIVTTEHDHYSHHESIRYAAARSGCGVRYIALFEQPATARADQIVDRIARAITPATRAVGVTWVQSSTGIKLPIAGIAEAVARANRGRAAADRCLLIVDGVHGFANQDVDIARLGADFFASGTHKWLFAPRGTGFLWGRSDAWPELRPTIPSFDPDGTDTTFEAWADRKELPPTQAAFVSPGGFLAYEHLLAIPAAVELHRTIGRDRIAARIAELNAAFREGAAAIPGLTLHTPRDPALAGGISCFEVRGMAVGQVVARLAEKKIRTTTSPYKVSYARVSAGIMNKPEEIELVLREIRALI